MLICGFCVGNEYINPKYNLPSSSVRYAVAKFDTQEELEEHRKTEEHQVNKKKCYCETCKEQCVSMLHYNDHQQQKHLNKVQFKCECCDVSFDFKSLLEKHLNTLKHREKENGKPEEVLDCETCCYHAANKHKLEQHYRTQKHQDKVNGVTKQEFSCCGFKFRSQTDYNRHIQTKSHSQLQK